MLFAEFDGKGPRWEFELKHGQTRPKMANCKNPRVTTKLLLLRHWYRHQEFMASAAEWAWIWPGEIGLLSRSPANWFRLIANISNRSRDLVRLRGGTPLASPKLAHAIFSPSVWPSSNLNLMPDLYNRILPKKNSQFMSFWVGVQF